MIRTMQLAGVHGWISLKLTLSRRYWLPRLTMAIIAGYALLFVSRHFRPEGWGPVVASLLIGISCLPLCRPDITGRTLPIPLPRRTLALASIVTQVLVCACVAMGFMLFDIGIQYLLALELHRLESLHNQIPGLLTSTELKAMVGIMSASLPFAVATVLGWSHVREPRNAWPNRHWREVLPFLFAATIGLTVAIVIAERFGAAPLVSKYLQIWLGGSVLFSGAAAFFYGWTAMFPESDSNARPPQPALKQLHQTVLHSQGIKWAVLLSGLVLYMTSSTWMHHRARPILICYAALLPFFTMPWLSGGEAVVGTQRYMGTWRWARSGWRLVPAPRRKIQRALLLDTLGFAVAATIFLHAIAILAAQTAPPNPNVDSWAQDLHKFTWTFTWFTGSTLPAMVIAMTPRRRFGIAPAIVAILATIWVFHTAIGGALALTLPVDNHAIVIASWFILAAIMWAQFESPTGQFLETDAPAGMASKRIGIVLSARSTRWTLAAVTIASMTIGLMVHRSAMKDALVKRQLEKITAAQTDRLIRDLRHISELDVLETTGRTRDAGPVLNPHIALDDGTPAETTAWWNDVSHRPMLNRRAAHWSTGPADVEIGDLSILAQLMAFDHWETGRLPSDHSQSQPASGAYETYLSRVPHESYLSIFQPAPNLLALVDLAKFRLLHGLRTGDVMPALKEVRHLARLMHSDETVIHTVLALSVLRIERRAFEAAIDRSLLAPTDWSVPSEHDLNAMHRAAVSLAYVISGGAEASQWQRIAELDKPPFGLCAALHEAVSVKMTYPSITPWPGELFPQRDMPFTPDALDTSHCSLPLARHSMARVRDSSMTMIPRDTFYRIGRLNFIQRLLSSEFSRSTLLMLHVPYLRGHAWAEIEAYSNLTGILMYGEGPEDDWDGVRVRHTPGPGAPAE